MPSGTASGAAGTARLLLKSTARTRSAVDDQPVDPADEATAAELGQRRRDRDLGEAVRPEQGREAGRVEDRRGLGEERRQVGLARAAAAPRGRRARRPGGRAACSRSRCTAVPRAFAAASSRAPGASPGRTCAPPRPDGRHRQRRARPAPAPGGGTSPAAGRRPAGPCAAADGGRDAPVVREREDVAVGAGLARGAERGHRLARRGRASSRRSPMPGRRRRRRASSWPGSARRRGAGGSLRGPGRGAPSRRRRARAGLPRPAPARPAGRRRAARPAAGCAPPWRTAVSGRITIGASRPLAPCTVITRTWSAVLLGAPLHRHLVAVDPVEEAGQARRLDRSRRRAPGRAARRCRPRPRRRAGR